MNLGSAMIWGFVATVVLSIVQAACQRLGLSRMSIPFLLGTMLTPNRDRALLVGTLWHIVNGWAFAFLYAAAFESMHAATWWLGVLGGAVHGLAALVLVVPLLPTMHPRMASETQGPEPHPGLEPPGFFAANYGRATGAIGIAAHIAYGAILGGFYRLS